MASADQISCRNLGRQSWASAPTKGKKGCRNRPGQRRRAERLRRGCKGWVGIAAEITPQYPATSDDPSVAAFGRQLLLRCPKFFARMRSQNFDRCHSFLLASSATGGARKRPPLHKGAFGTGDADCRVASLLAMTVLNLCHSEEAQRADVGIRPFYDGRGFGPPYLGHGLRRPNFVPKFGASVKSSAPTERER